MARTNFPIEFCVTCVAFVSPKVTQNNQCSTLKNRVVSPVSPIFIHPIYYETHIHPKIKTYIYSLARKRTSILGDTGDTSAKNQYTTPVILCHPMVTQRETGDTNKGVNIYDIYPRYPR